MFFHTTCFIINYNAEKHIDIYNIVEENGCYIVLFGFNGIKMINFVLYIVTNLFSHMLYDYPMVSTIDSTLKC